jgi:hypothetical protein
MCTPNRKPPIVVVQTYDPEEMARRGRLGAQRLHQVHDARTLTEPGRAAFLARFERQVDPDGSLPEAERQRLAEAARRAYFRALGRHSAAVRRANALREVA